VVAGRELTARTVWPASAGALPTADHPALAMVLVPRSGQGPTWVFPFDRPGAPGPGGNQAMAVVTRDGGTAYDVAFALVWVNGGTALNRNEAYAFASCRDCRAVAIGFQVVLVVGHADVVAPQNLSAAVSYHCLRCMTEALAAQLVITVPHRLSGSAMQQLTALWRQIEAFGRHLRGLTFAQIRARIASYERQILAIVRPDLTNPPAPSPSPSLSVSSSVSATESPTGSPPAGASTTASVAPTASASDTGSASASPQPAPSESVSPSVSPSPSTAGASTSP
jgi:putative peptide zinc metalloprotease protein